MWKLRNYFLWGQKGFQSIVHPCIVLMSLCKLWKLVHIVVVIDAHCVPYVVAAVVCGIDTHCPLCVVAGLLLLACGGGCGDTELTQCSFFYKAWPHHSHISVPWVLVLHRSQFGYPYPWWSLADTTCHWCAWGYAAQSISNTLGQWHKWFLITQTHLPQTWSSICWVHEHGWLSGL